MVPGPLGMEGCLPRTPFLWEPHRKGGLVFRPLEALLVLPDVKEVNKFEP